MEGTVSERGSLRGDHRFVGHSASISIDEALQDAVQQARAIAPGKVFDFHVVNIRGRVEGGRGDLWVEIKLGPPPTQEEDEPRYTTLALGEEGGEESAA
jgi:flavin-binding protein dodecin